MARKKRRSHLTRLKESRENKLYETKIEDCEFWFKVLNKEIFNNELEPLDEMVIGRRRGALAFYECTQDDEDNSCFEARIFFDRKYKTKHQFVSVLFHELIHHYQALNKEPLGHGPSFFKWKKKAKKNGLELRIAYLK